MGRIHFKSQALKFSMHFCGSSREQNSKEAQTAALQAAPFLLASSSSNCSSAAAANHTDMKRSAVKELIERYFYQLQRGCGNPKCNNVYCASSGKVAAMSPNEIAAKAIQLFSQEAKLCDLHTQTPKVPKTGAAALHESPSSSSTVSNATTPSVAEFRVMSSPTQTSSSTSSSSNSTTMTSGSSTSSSSTGSSSNTNISSCATEELPLLEALGGVDAAKKVIEQLANSCNSNNKEKLSDPPTPTLAPVEYLNEQLLDELIEECSKFNSFDPLLHAISEVFCSVTKLSKSFKRPPLVKLNSTATATKLHEILGKSPRDLKKEDLRTLEGEHDKDEDSTCCMQADDDDDEDVNADDVETAMNEQAAACVSVDMQAEDADSSAAHIEPMDEDEASDDLDDIVLLTQSTDTQVDLESLRRVKKKLYGLNNNAVGEVLNNNIILLAEYIKYCRFHDWEKVLHCFVICFDMATTSKCWHTNEIA